MEFFYINEAKSYLEEMNLRMKTTKTDRLLLIDNNKAVISTGLINKEEGYVLLPYTEDILKDISNYENELKFWNQIDSISMDVPF